MGCGSKSSATEKAATLHFGWPLGKTKQPCGEVHMMKKTEASQQSQHQLGSQVQVATLKQAAQSSSRLLDECSPADILNATSPKDPELKPT